MEGWKNGETGRVGVWKEGWGNRWEDGGMCWGREDREEYAGGSWMNRWTRARKGGQVEGWVLKGRWRDEQMDLGYEVGDTSQRCPGTL